MSVSTLQQQGRDYYKRKEYVKALECFDRAIGRLPSVQLLDHRAACHIKLDDLPTALKDAKKTIQLGREDPTGYLRAGKILIAMEKPGVALEICSHGLRCVKQVGQGYEALKKAREELQTQLAPLKTIDPLTVLPCELALDILGYLSFRQTIRISRVSKQWNLFIRSEPELWRHLDLTDARTKVKSVFISKCINTARNRLREVTLNRLYDFDKTLIALTKFCPIEKITLLQTGLQNLNLAHHLTTAVKLRELKIGYDTLLSFEALVSLLQACGNTLEVFELVRETTASIIHVINVPQLRSLSIKILDPVQLPETYQCFTRTSPRLESLKLTELFTPRTLLVPMDLSLAQHMTCVDLTVSRPRASSIILPPSLRTLKLHVVGIQTPNDFFGSTSIETPDAFHLPYLETIDLRIPGLFMQRVMCGLGLQDTSHMGIESVQSIRNPGETYGPVSKIKSLSLAEITPDDGFLGWCDSRLAELEHLAVRQPILDMSADFYDSPVLAAITGLSQLRSLDLSGTTIDGAGVKKVISGSAHALKVLTLNDCWKLGRDAVDWARSKGIKVEHKTTSTASGRKVRYN